MKILGLDIGTTSIGWSIINENQSVEKAGVHIFPVGVKDDDFNKSGKEVSKNIGRRMARGARRLIFRYKIRREQLKRILVEMGMMPDFTVINEKVHYLPLKAKDLFYIRAKALDEKISLQEMGRILLLLNQRRGFKSGRKDKGKGDEKETSKLKIAMSDLDKEIELSGSRTLGEFYWKLFEETENIPNWRNPDEPISPLHNKAHRIEIGRYAFRKTYEIEFDAIWEVQKQYHSILTDELKEQIKNRTIFYQRRLKSAKHLVNNCRIYPKKKAAPCSHPVYQEFRIWQSLSNLRVTVPSSNPGEYRSQSPLTLEEKHVLANELKYISKLTEPQTKKLLGMPRDAEFNKIEGFGTGNKTLAQFKDSLGLQKLRSMSEDEIDQLWHVLYCADEDRELFRHLIEFYQYSPDEADKLISVNLEEEYGSLSQKAMKGLVAHMKEGMDYTEANLALGVHHSQDELDNPDRKLLERLVYSKKDDDLRNPLVNKTVSETIRLVNTLISTHGKPDLVRIEFARSLQKPKKFREEELSRNRDKNLRREEYLEFLHARIGQHLIRKSDLTKFELWLEMEFYENDLKKIAPQIDIEEFRRFTRNVNSRDRTKFDLWLECGRISPYTGQVINLSQLFSSEIEVEHIIPYSISQDNSFINLTLAEKSFNDKAKRNRTPLQAFELLGEAELLGFRKRVSHFSEGKQKRLLFDGSEEQLKKFRPSDLANTAYISKVVRRKLLTAVQKVQVTNGQVTAKLREFWGLNEILNPEGTNEKSRLDHRHHAIDAIAIAFSSPSFIQKLSSEATFDHRGRMRIAKFDSPFTGFQEKVKEVTDGIFVSYRVESRLLVEKQNKYIHSTSKGQKPQRTITVRGALHEETYYGQIQNPETGKQNYVTRKPLSILKKLEDLDKIVDKATRQRLLDFLESKGAKSEKQIQEALAGGFFYKSKDGSKDIPVYKVRIMNPSSGMIQVRPKENPNIWVESGSNYIFAIYQGPDGKRSFSNFSVFDSVKELKKSGQLVKPFDSEGKPLLYTFQTNEMFISYENHPEEIDWNDRAFLFSRLYKVVKFDKNGYLISSIHNLSGVKVNAAKDYPIGTVLAKTFNSWRGIKVKVTAAGEIIPV